MENQNEDTPKVNSLTIISFTTGLLGMLAFFLMFNWKYGEYLIIPTLLFGFISLIASIISFRQILKVDRKWLTHIRTYLLGFGIAVGFCILLWFLIALFTHY